ncbi:MAG: phosphoglucomutase (alpha-D-glucose-1,6-bisphosphate-dependent) [Rhodanobacteraceae bacterium]
MSSKTSPLAGKPAPASLLVDVPRLVTRYFSERPDPSIEAQRVAFGTSGHRGSSLELSFNENHVLAISQAICDYRKREEIAGPLFLGIDTHALSAPAFASALEVLAANHVEIRIAADNEYTPTPAISHAILCHNRVRDDAVADGIVITPSHNPPDNGGFKYNPPNGGPADGAVTRWIEKAANSYLERHLHGVRRVDFEKALKAATTRTHDYVDAYVGDLGNAIDFDVIRAAGIHLGVDPMGGAGVHYWARIAERYDIDLDVVSETVDPRFGFMSVDWDGQIRMDPSSHYAMQRLIGLRDRYDIAFACDTDHDRHGIVTKSAGLLPANHYLAVAIDYLFRQRSDWRKDAAVGKTVVSSRMIDRVAERLGRDLFEVPVGFKWFVEGLFDGALAFAGEESAGASFARRDGSTWTTDKDGIVAALLSAEILARTQIDPGNAYKQLALELGETFADRVEAPATPPQKAALAKLAPEQISIKQVAGDAVTGVLSRAPGNDEPIGGIKVCTANGWFAARPSGTEDIYKIYAESFRDQQHLKAILGEAQAIVDGALKNV